MADKTKKIGACIYCGDPIMLFQAVSHEGCSIEKGRQEVIKLAVENDILCTEEEAVGTGCVICKAFWQVLKEGKDV